MLTATRGRLSLTPTSGEELAQARSAAPELPFALEYPRVRDTTAEAEPDVLRLYRHPRPARATFTRSTRSSSTAAASGEYYDVQGSTWTDPPLLSDPSQTVQIGSRTYSLFYAGEEIRTIAWHEADAEYWIQNTLTNTVQPREMLAIAEQTLPVDQRPSQRRPGDARRSRPRATSSCPRENSTPRASPPRSRPRSASWASPSSPCSHCSCSLAGASWSSCASRSRTRWPSKPASVRCWRGAPRPPTPAPTVPRALAVDAGARNRDNRSHGQPRPPDSAGLDVPAPRGPLERPHARRVGDGLRGHAPPRCRSSSTTCSAGCTWCRATASAWPTCRSTRAGRCGPMTRTSTPTTTSATPPCPTRLTTPRSSAWPGGCSRSAWTAPSRCGRSGWCRACPAGASR